MGWFAGDLIPANESLPGRVDCRRIRQQVKHVLEPGEFARSSIRRHAQAVLLDGSRCDNPEFEEVLWNDMKDEAAARQNLKCPRGGLVLGVTNLDRAQKCAGID
jgi:hypothetical protein